MLEAQRYPGTSDTGLISHSCWFLWVLCKEKVFHTYYHHHHQVHLSSICQKMLAALPRLVQIHALKLLTGTDVGIS